MRKGYTALGAMAIIGFAAVSSLYYMSSNGAQSINLHSFTGNKDIEVQFFNFAGKYQKQYSTKEEFIARLKNFQENVLKMQKHNSLSSSSFKMGINRFSDMTFEEYQKLLGLKANGMRSRKHENSGENSFIVFNTTDLPTSVDWRNTGAVTKVKDQGSCGSCYAFSAVGAIEGQYFMKTNKSVDLSVEQVVDCSDSYHNQGCGGGLPDWVFDYVWDNGLQTDADYPYKNGQGFCNDEPSKYVVGMTHYYDVTHLNPDQLKGAVQQVGPISIGVGAGNDAWFHYTSGIIDSIDICKPNLDHAVLLVGYG